MEVRLGVTEGTQGSFVKAQGIGQKIETHIPTLSFSGLWMLGYAVEGNSYNYPGSPLPKKAIPFDEEYGIG